MPLAVLTGELHRGPVLACAEVPAVDDQTLFAALHLQDELGNRSIGNTFEASANTTFDRVNAPNQLNIDLTMQVLTEHTSSIKQAVRFLQAAN